MARDADGWIARVPADWLQGRSTFGGLQSALALRALRSVAPEHPLRVLQTTFIAPVGEGAMRIVPSVLRAGKTTIHAEAKIFDGSTLAALVVGVFGKSRPSEIRVVPRQPVVDRSRIVALPRGAGFVPAFLQHFDTRWLRGGPPGSGATSTEAVVEVDLRDTGPVTEAHVVAIADVTPPVALSMLKASSPGSSLTWTLEMLREEAFEALPLGTWRLDVELVAGGGGYTSQSEIVWGPGGEPIAISRQSMVVFG